MKEIKKILCYLDPISHAKSAIKQTLTLAKLHNATICFVSVLKPISSPLASLQQTYIHIQEGTIERQLKESNANPEDHEIRVITGSLGALEVVTIAVKENFDLIIKPTDDKGHNRVSIFGSNDQQLFRKSSVPVWINKPTKSFQCKRLLAAVDIDPDQPENIDLNRGIIGLAKEMAQAFDAELHVVHAWHVPYASLLKESGQHAIIEKAESAVKDLHIQQEQLWKAFLSEYELDNTPSANHFIQGDVDKVVSDLALTLDIDTVVMGTVARTGIEGFFIGNTAEKILSKLDCSVLAIKPDSFSPPVK
ncbi:universal stress protein [Alkalimarinus alittae]|uniref:Universal stress protein n=1 Tax=Alkalimarinus alittae TaxID=2961619 RepID=A0ABY6N003_9ALTE|nr:universal stress protein [Alkalimarinus alittae]UZE95365.1 universal stress protein [Alkalimarinus alittae]